MRQQFIRKLTATCTVLLVAEALVAQGQRIVGGADVPEGTYPWMVEMLFIEDEHLCGATLIHPEWVLTAGHCALVGDGANMRLIANSINNTTALPGPLAEELLVDTIHYHPDYDGLNGPDLALIHLAQPAVTPVVPLLAPGITDGLDPGDPAFALGWGNADTVVIGPSDTLQAVIVPLVGFDACAALYAGSTSDLFNLNGTLGLLCAAGEPGQPAIGSGNGDSGGPLLIEQEDGWHQVGVVYGGEGQYASAQHPGVYTSIPYNWEWIQATINGTVAIADMVPPSVACVRAGRDALRLELPSDVQDAVVELIGGEGRLLARERIGGTEAVRIPWPEYAPFVIASVMDQDGRVLHRATVVRPW